MSVEPRAIVPVLDLSTSAAPLTLEITTSAAAELLLLIATVSMAHEGSFELGAERLRGLKGEAAGRIDELREQFVACGEKIPTNLMGAILELDDPRDVPDLLAWLDRSDPVDVHLRLLGTDNRSSRLADAATLRQAFEGDDELRERLRREAESDEHTRRLAGLIAMRSDHVKAELTELLSGWAPVFDTIRDEAMAPIERDAAARRAATGQATPEAVVEDATNGVQLVRTAGLRRVVLLPTYVFRPWVLLTEHGDTRVISYPVADEHLALDGGSPPPQLVKVFKALSDEGRLKLLRRLATGPVTLRDAMDELGVAKSTAHHHLAVLRQAGLVLVNAEDNLYSLRRDHVPDVADQLVRYLDVDVAGA